MMNGGLLNRFSDFDIYFELDSSLEPVSSVAYESMRISTEFSLNTMDGCLDDASGKIFALQEAPTP